MRKMHSFINTFYKCEMHFLLTAIPAFMAVFMARTSQSRHKSIQTHKSLSSHTSGDNLETSINLTCMSLGCGRKPEHPA